jgi:hypothetical protein
VSGCVGRGPSALFCPGKIHFTKRGALGHKCSLTPPLFNEVPVPNHESEWWRIFVSILLLLPFRITRARFDFQDHFILQLTD